jgi:hypothetical protein
VAATTTTHGICCELCREPVEAYALLGAAGVVIVDRDAHGLGRYALMGKQMLVVVRNEVATEHGDGRVQEARCKGLNRFRAHADTCTKLAKYRDAVQPKTKRMPIRERRSR